MAKRTYVPMIKFLCEELSRKIQKYEKTIRQNLGDGPYAALLFVVDLCAVVVSIIEQGSDTQGDWEGPEPTLSPANINQIRAAIDAFWARLGLEGA